MQAKTSGKFSSEELDKLWRELQHHKEKVQEYHALLETLGGAEGAPCAVGAQTVPERWWGGWRRCSLRQPGPRMFQNWGGGGSTTPSGVGPKVLPAPAGPRLFQNKEGVVHTLRPPGF